MWTACLYHYQPLSYVVICHIQAVVRWTSTCNFSPKVELPYEATMSISIWETNAYLPIVQVPKLPSYRSKWSSKKSSLISGPWIPKSDLFSDAIAQPNMAGGSNWGKIWRWIFQRSDDRGSVPLPLGSLLIVLGEQTCARFSGGPRKYCIIVVRNHFCYRKFMSVNADKGRYDLHKSISESYF